MLLTANCSSKSPAAISRDGAHWSPQPWVPGAYAITGRVPPPLYGAVGTNTVPEIAADCPLTSRERYKICQARLPDTGEVSGRHQMMSPCASLGGGLG